MRRALLHIKDFPVLSHTRAILKYTDLKMWVHHLMFIWIIFRWRVRIFYKFGTKLQIFVIFFPPCVLESLCPCPRVLIIVLVSLSLCLCPRVFVLMGLSSCLCLRVFVLVSLSSCPSVIVINQFLNHFAEVRLAGSDKNLEQLSKVYLSRTNFSHCSPPHIISQNIISPNIISPNIISSNIISPNIISPNIISPNIISPNIISQISEGQKAYFVCVMERRTGGVSTDWIHYELLCQRTPVSCGNT